MSETFRKMIKGTQRLTALDDVDEVVKGLAGLLKRTVKSRWTVIYLFDRERRDFAPARSSGLPKRFIPISNGCRWYRSRFLPCRPLSGKDSTCSLPTMMRPDSSIRSCGAC